MDTWLSFRRVGIYNDPMRVLGRHRDLPGPENARVQNNLGVVLVDASRPAEAVPHYERALELKPDYVEGGVELGRGACRLQAILAERCRNSRRRWP